MTDPNRLIPIDLGNGRVIYIPLAAVAVEHREHK
jgi:hypothetical protein